MGREVEDNGRSSRLGALSKGKILEGDGTPVDAVAYSTCYPRMTFTFIGYFLTLGILWLVFHWFPHWKLKCTYKRSSFSEAQMILIKVRSLVVTLQPFQDSCGKYFTQKVVKPSYGVRLQSDDKSEEDMHSAYFMYKKLKYVWSQSSEHFELLRTFFVFCSPWDEQTYSELFPARPLPEEVVHQRRALYGPNVIGVHLTPIINMLVNECLNPFYCFQAFSCALWFSDEYYMYASCIVLISAISIITQIYEMRKNQRALKKTVCGSSPVLVCREVNGFTEFSEVDSTELVPGDIFEIPRNGCVMHCDAILLSGNCILNESTLTGKIVHPSGYCYLIFLFVLTKIHIFLSFLALVLQHFKLFPNLKFLLRSRCFSKAECSPVTKDSTTPNERRSEEAPSVRLDCSTPCLFLDGRQQYNSDFVNMHNEKHRSGSSVKSIVLRSLDLITVCVPPALPMAMTVGVVFAQRRLRSKHIYCINPSLINVCGVINLTCFDKTGTLTEDGLDLWGVVPMLNGRFVDPHFDPSEFDRGPLLESMATCHSLTLIEGVLSGDPLDLKMFQSTKWEFIEETEDHCKFDMAVPAIVRPCTQNSSDNFDLVTKHEVEKLPYEVGILRQFPFTSSLQRMSVIARVLDSSHFSVYTKGAPEMIESLCRRDTVPSNFHSVLLEYTREGYRVLALAWRPLKISYTRMLKIQRERVEQDLLFLGLLVMENRLKPESASVIQVLRNANVRPVMVTGDNMLTAVSVARDCEMIDELDRIVIVSAKPPPEPLTTPDISPTDLTAAAAGGDVSWANHRPPVSPDMDLTTNPPPDMASGVCSGQPTAYSAIFGDHQTAPLVEFHYAEDLHRPVTEVTATNVTAARNLRREMSRENRRFRPPKERTTFTTFYEAVPVEQPEADRSPGTIGVGERSSHSLFDSLPPKSRSKAITSATAHRINIRMIDRPDFHLAISGKTWAIIKEHYPWLIPKLVVKGTVFARFSPDQKTQLVEALQSVGYFVAMCGDGANDCGALKAAHAGVSLSEAEASVASPFTSKQQNIGCVPTLIREGRCALVTSFGTLKFITGYSLVQSISVISLFYTLVYRLLPSLCRSFLHCVCAPHSHHRMNDLLVDVQLHVYGKLLLSVCRVNGFLRFYHTVFGYTKPYPHLSIKPPRMRLLSTITLLSLCCQIAAHLATQVTAFVLVRVQPWYISLFTLSENYELSNYESTVLFTVASYQYLILVVVFSKGAPYRRSMVTNYFFIVNVAVCLVCTLCITASNFGIRNTWFSLVLIPSPMYVLMLHLMVLANFLFCYLIESLVEGVAFRQQLVHIRRALFPRRVQRKDYERIREEIDRLAGSWPPLIRSASVQALPKELFQDIDVAPPASKSSVRQRKRNMSGMSTETEDEELFPAGHLTETVVFCAPLAGSAAHSQQPTPLSHVHKVVGHGEVINRSSTTLRRRSHSFDVSELEAWKQHRPPITESMLEENEDLVNNQTGPCKFLDMPDSMFRRPDETTNLPRMHVREKRKRHQSTGPQSEPIYAKTVNRAPGDKLE
ncbi:putative cation-transporting atpase worm [Fasciola gigantica]|uniref:Cation-transporting ATPase n=1 Tax=Fasciola gigantica TaxID=46835 RepID=A0A504Y918_FASGI|nr:putative cation-transporting atpase worm [Fasciola gigantica]